MSSTPQPIRTKALACLARREYSRYELQRKLARAGFEAEAVDGVLEHLEAERWLSDERFAKAYINLRAARGQGPLRIGHELRQRGVDDALVQACLDSHPGSWRELIHKVRCKKFGPVLPEAYHAVAKQAAFLRYRGFDSGLIASVLKTPFDE